MKPFVRLAPVLILAAAALAGCATGHSGLVLAPVGPTVVTAGASSPTTGQLLVFSAHDPSPHFNSLPYEDFYTDYQIVAPDGKRRTIRNNPNPSVPGPVAVALPTGEYSIVARANGYGTVTVPVVIASNQTTTVHLDSEGAWLPDSKFTGANPVRLPDGEIVGCSAVPSNAHGTPEKDAHP